MPFSHYMSLGINCEAAFQFRRVLGRDYASFFNWNVTPIETLVRLLEADFEDICLFENLVFEGNGTLVRDKAYDYHFHWVGANIDCLDGGGLIYHKNRERLLYLAEKFRRTTASGRSIAFFVTFNGQQNLALLNTVAHLLRTKFQCGDFKIIALTDKSGDLAFLSADDSIVARSLTRFAPWHDATDGHVSSWDQVFAEFPPEIQLRLSGY